MTATVQRAAAVRVQYVRGPQTIPAAAVIADVEIEVTGPFGWPVTSRATDFLVETQRLVMDGKPIEPEPGDRVRVDRKGRWDTYEVTTFGDQGHCEPADPYGVSWRIHTKLVATG
ncbi:MAG TPA: hypothetical protein VMY35_17375 [Phycisphaerae bacterium]|nr:hypothetical protein [Phycisphaerae bacterium]